MDTGKLQDPNELAKEDYDYLDEKIRIVKTILGRHPKRGGMPFIHAFSMNKPHVLEDVTCMLWSDPESKEKITVGTAATDGKKYYWHPDVLRDLHPLEISYIMAHETYHMILSHCDPDRTYGKIKWAWAASIDYVVNAMIEHDVRECSRMDLPSFNINSPKTYKGQEHPLWNGGLTKHPIYLEEIYEKLRQESLKNKKLKAKGIDPASVEPERPKDLPDNPKLRDLSIYCDYNAYGQSAEDIYRKIVEHLDDEMQDQAKAMSPGAFGISMDEHRDITTNRQELLEEILEAAATVEKSAGSVPSAIKEKLAELEEPKLRWQDLVRNTLNKRRKDKGSKNDWSRYRRRPLSWGQYIPKKKDDYVRWLAMLDTSGSMSGEDMRYGVSQLKVLDGRSEGIVIPCDAQPYWNDAVVIKSTTDLPTIKCTGRGGTCFSEFFTDYEKYVGADFDVIIIMTDCGIWDLDRLKKPKSEVVWVPTVNVRFNPPFGRVAPMRRQFKF